jgi:phosphatidylserine decarboxylase
MPEPETAPQATAYLDRETGEIRNEQVFGEKTLCWIYQSRASALLRPIARSRLVNHLYGAARRSPRSRKGIEGFVRSLGIDASEAELPLTAYRSLDDFFTRRLRPGARPLDPNPRSLLFPCDGRALVYPKLDGERLQVKGCRVEVSELLEDRKAAERYAGGSAIVVRLAPADYHRFHFPASGEAGVPRPIRGPLESVHPIALAAGAPSLRNKRVVTSLSTRDFGEIAIVEVGALVVGTIVQTFRPGPAERGQEKGYFRFGGSTVVLLVERGRLAIDADLLEASARGLETRVKMGTRIGQAA